MNIKTLRNSGILYPLLVSAAIAVILCSAVGVATMTGVMPGALSRTQPAEVTSQADAPGTADALAPRDADRDAPPPVAAQAANPCDNCGVIESVQAVQVKGKSSGVGAVAGGVVGGLIGHSFGGGTGRIALTLLGAGGGALAGNEIEKNVKKTERYRVRVRMDDGTLRTIHETQAPAWHAGDKVRIVDGRLVSAS